MEFVIAGLRVRRTYTSGPKMMNTPCFISQVCLVLINKSVHKKMPEEGTRVWQFTILLECVCWVNYCQAAEGDRREKREELCMHFATVHLDLKK